LSVVLKIYHIGKIEVDQAEMFDAKVALVNIANRIPDTYNTNER
jgi:hypothetical protein